MSGPDERDRERQASTFTFGQRFGRETVEREGLAGSPGASSLVHDVVAPAVAAIRAVRDPVSRAFAAEDAIEAAGHLRGELARERRDAVRELRGTGRPPLRTWAEVGELIGVSGPRASQIAELDADRSAPRGPRG